MLLAAALLLGSALAAARDSRPRLALGLIVAAGLGVRLYAASEPTLHEWDERYHALVAKHLLEHPLAPTLYDPALLPFDPQDWKASHVWLNKPPLALWLMAGSLGLFGLSELALRLPSVLLSGFGIVLTFLIGRRLFDDRTALLAAAFHALNGLLVALASGRAPCDHVDTALITLLEGGVWLSILEADGGGVGTRVALGATLGAALLTKWFPAFLILPLWAFLSLRRRSMASTLRAAAPVLAAALAVAGPWVWHIVRTHPRDAFWAWSVTWAHLTRPLSPREAGPWFHLASMPKFFGELVYVPMVWALVTARGDRSRPLQLLLVWLALPYAIFSLAATKMPAYVMVAAPAVFLIEARFWWWLHDAWETVPTRLWRSAVLALLALLPARYLLRPGGPFATPMERPEWVGRIIGLRSRFRGERAVLFNVAHPIEAMFYLPWPAYPGHPSPEELVSLEARGYTVLLYDETTGTARRLSATLSPGL